MRASTSIVEADNRELIANHLKKIERDWGWLSKKTGIPYGTLYYCFVRKQFNISKDKLKKINEVLETKFEKNKI